MTSNILVTSFNGKILIVSLLRQNDLQFAVDMVSFNCLIAKTEWLQFYFDIIQ